MPNDRDLGIILAHVEALSAQVEELQNELIGVQNTNAREHRWPPIPGDEGIGYPGYGHIGSRLFYDPDLAPNESQFRMGTIITDNSTGGAKTWIVADLAADSMSYEDIGWPSDPHDPTKVYAYRAHLAGPFEVHRTG